MNNLIVYSIAIACILIVIFLGLLISKINSKLSWKQVILIKYKVMIVVPLINIISNCIVKNKELLDKLYEFRNKLMNILTQS